MALAAIEGAYSTYHDVDALIIAVTNTSVAWIQWLGLSDDFFLALAVDNLILAMPPRLISSANAPSRQWSERSAR
jgi:hypothetical protein